MRDFELLRTPRRRSEVDEQTRTSTIYGRAETGDFEGGGPARGDRERGVPAPCLAVSVFYRWRAVAQGGSAVALKRDAQRTPRKDDPEARHKAEMERMRAVIAEITAENLGAEKKDLKLDDLYRVPAETKAAVMQIVEQTKRRSGWRVYRTLAALGVPRSVYYAWKARDSLEDQTAKPCRVYEVLPEERAAICEFALRYPKIGYRKLTWMMVDAGTACVGESTVYRVLSDADLLSRWKRSTASSGEYNFRPKAPNEQWHTDVMYVWVAARFYFLVSFVDAYSRYIVHHKLLMSLDGKSVAIELQAALEAAKDAKPRVVHDHGSEFVNRDVAAVIKAHNLIDIKTKPRHPNRTVSWSASMAPCAPRATTTTATITCRPKRSSPSSCSITTKSDYMRP
jgi:transposase InsO family protein